MNSKNEDYISQLSSLKDSYIQSSNIQIISLSKRSKKYLEKIYYKIVDNNELMFESRPIPQFYIIKGKSPFYFSLPQAQFFFSSALLENYVKNEDLLASIMAFQIVKSLRNIYSKKIIFPLGFIRTNRLLSLVRVPLNVKNEINQWAYITMKRAGFDSSAYLMWLQIQNKQSLDFSIQYGSMQSISREELVFKNFIAKRQGQDFSLSKEKNSSNDYYNFIKNILRGRLIKNVYR